MDFAKERREEGEDPGGGQGTGHGDCGASLERKTTQVGRRTARAGRTMHNWIT